MVLFLADDLPSANLHPLSSLLPKLFQIMNLITSSGGRFKRKGYKYGYICMKSVYKALGYGKKSCSVIAIYIMEDSLTNVNPAINFSAFPTLSDILKHQVILWNWEICTTQTFGSIKLTDSLIKCMPTFVQCYQIILVTLLLKQQARNTIMAAHRKTSRIC